MRKDLFIYLVFTILSCNSPEDNSVLVDTRIKRSYSVDCGETHMHLVLYDNRNIDSLVITHADTTLQIEKWWDNGNLALIKRFKNDRTYTFSNWSEDGTLIGNGHIFKIDTIIVYDSTLQSYFHKMDQIGNTTYWFNNGKIRYQSIMNEKRDSISEMTWNENGTLISSSKRQIKG